MWNATNNSFRTDLNKVPIEKNETPIRKYQTDYWDLTFTTISAVLDKLKEEKQKQI